MFSILAAIGIMAALNEEADVILDHMQQKETVEVGCQQVNHCKIV